MQYKVSFNNSNKVFFNTLKSAVDEYFSKNNIKKTGNSKLYIKSAILITATLAIYVSVMVIPMPVWPGSDSTSCTTPATAAIQPGNG
jgi:linoleoyl-CoA desaturase